MRGFRNCGKWRIMHARRARRGLAGGATERGHGGHLLIGFKTAAIFLYYIIIPYFDRKVVKKRCS